MGQSKVEDEDYQSYHHEFVGQGQHDGNVSISIGPDVAIGADEATPLVLRDVCNGERRSGLSNSIAKASVSRARPAVRADR